MSRPQAPTREALRRAFLDDLREKIKADVSEALAKPRSRHALSEAVARAQATVDQNVDMVLRIADGEASAGAAKPPVSCRPGCSHCCHMRVELSIGELVRLVRTITERMSPEELQALLERCRDHREALEGVLGADRLNRAVPCPLLVDGLCSMHEVRPIRCRVHHSLDVSLCIKGRDQPDKVRLPQYTDIAVLSQPISEGIAAALRFRGLASEEVELGRVLAQAIEDPALLDRWLDEGAPL